MVETNTDNFEPIDDGRDPNADDELRLLFRRSIPTVPPFDLDTLLNREASTSWHLARRPSTTPTANGPRSPNPGGIPRCFC